MRSLGAAALLGSLIAPVVAALLGPALLAACSDAAGSSCQGAACPPACNGAPCPPGADGGGVDGATTGDGATTPPLACPLARINTSSPAKGASLGAAVAIDGTLAAAGAPTSPGPGGQKNSGAIHVLVRDGCNFTHKGATVPAAAAGYDAVGASVALRAGTLVVGAPDTKTYTAVGTTVSTLSGVGAVYAARLAGDVPATNAFLSFGMGRRAYDRSGRAVAVASDGTTIAFGEPGADYLPGSITVDDTGQAFVGTFGDGGTPTVTGGLYIGDLAGGGKSAYAGSALAFVGARVVVGAPGMTNNTGAVFLYTSGDGGPYARTSVAPATPMAGSRFGASVAADGDLLVVGAPDQTEGGAASAGAVYVFARQSDGAYVEAQKLNAKDGAAKDHFGTAVAVGRDVILVGAPHESTQPAHGGAVYVFRREGTGWTESRKLAPPDGTAGDLFGAALDVSGEVALVGAPAAGTYDGALYAFSP